MRLRLLEILFLIFISGQVLGGKYKIRGELAGQHTGKVLVLTRGELRQLDTLGIGIVEDGKFTIAGELKTPCVAMMVAENRPFPQVILLDTDKEFKVSWPESGRAIVKGGYLQETLNKYLQITKTAGEKLKAFNAEVKKAADAMHMKTAAELKKKIELNKSGTRKEIEKLVDKNRGNLFAAYILTGGMDRMNLPGLKACYACLNEQERNLEPGQTLQALIRGLEEVSMGSIAPDFTLRSLAGEELSMYSVKGKLKIIDFWASWCGPCRLENPNMVALYADFKEKGLAIISVSLDNKKEAWVKAIEKDGLNWIHLSSLEGWESEVVKQYGVDAVPYIYVLDENNRILAKQIRGKELRTFVEQRLK